MFWGVRLASIVGAVAFCYLLQMMAVGVENSTELPGIRLFALAGLYVTLAVSLNLINGITGQFSMGHAAFYMVGAYTGGFLSNLLLADKMPLSHLPPPAGAALMMVCGGIGAAIAGLIVGLPSLRLRGDYLAVVTLGFGEIVRIIVINNQALGGSYGMNVRPKFELVWLIWLLAIGCIACCRNLLKTAHGLSFLAVREDEIASSAMGVNITKVKVVAFVLGAAFAGMAGGLYANLETLVTPSTFPMDLSFIILTMVVLGGTGSITGSAIAAVILFYLPEQLRNLGPITGTQLTGTAIGLGITVFILKKLADHYHGKRLTKNLLLMGTIIGGVIASFVLGLILTRVAPELAKKSFEANQLRMVIFSVALIALMLLRPEGMLAHHEFSWSFVKNLFGGKAPKKEVAA